MARISKSKPKPGATPIAPYGAASGGNGMTGGMAIVEQLLVNGIDRVFGLPGAQMYPLFDALQQRSDRIRTFGARHEQTCAYMAFGYARATGRPGVFSVVPGPGVLNATAALATALGACQPVLCITGQVPSQYLDRGRGHLHELPDQRGLLDKLVKWTARIERIADAPAVVNEAFRQMLSGRPGPVVIEMPWDTMAASDQVKLLPPAEIPTPPPPSPIEIERAAALLAHARHPMIFVGSGAQHAAAEIRAFAESIAAPVVGFRGGRGIVPEDHDLGITCATAHRLWPEIDVAIGIGTRMELPFMRWSGMMTLNDKPTPPPHVIRIDIDPAEMRRLRVHAPIIADARSGTAALHHAVKQHRAKTASMLPDAIRRIASARALAAKATAKVQPQMAYLDVIREVIPRNGILVEELCQAGFTSYFGYPVYEPRSYISSGHQGTLGFGLPTALGVKAARPDVPVVSIIGDGGFMFGVQDMATAVQEGLNVVTILFNNNSYGNVLRDQRVGFGNRTIGAILENPDFQMLGRSFRVETHRVTSPEELRPILRSALRANAPVLIEVDVPQGSEVSPWEFLHPAPAKKD